MYEHTDISKLVTPPAHQDAGTTWLHAMMHERREFARCVDQIFFWQSVLDPVFDSQGQASVQGFCCLACKPCATFSSEKALQSHIRAKHKVRSSIPLYINDTGLCPICKADFRSRIRVISHLSDVRRPKCRDRILAGEVPAIAELLFVQLQDRDKQLRKEALHQGHTHPIATGPALSAGGLRIGHVRQ